MEVQIKDNKIDKQQDKNKHGKVTPRRLQEVSSQQHNNIVILLHSSPPPLLAAQVLKIKIKK